MLKAVNIIALVVLGILLVLIRFFEDSLFYDPYLTFFQNDYLYLDSPRREVIKLVAFTTLRYVLNSVISLGILYVVFKDKSIIKFSAIIYGIAFSVLILLFLYFIAVGLSTISFFRASKKDAVAIPNAPTRKHQVLYQGFSCLLIIL